MNKNIPAVHTLTLGILTAALTLAAPALAQTTPTPAMKIKSFQAGCRGVLNSVRAGSYW